MLLGKHHSESKTGGNRKELNDVNYRLASSSRRHIERASLALKGNKLCSRVDTLKKKHNHFKWFRVRSRLFTEFLSLMRLYVYYYLVN